MNRVIGAAILLLTVMLIKPVYAQNTRTGLYNYSAEIYEIWCPNPPCDTFPCGNPSCPPSLGGAVAHDMITGKLALNILAKGVNGHYEFDANDPNKYGYIMVSIGSLNFTIKSFTVDVQDRAPGSGSDTYTIDGMVDLGDTQDVIDDYRFHFQLVDNDGNQWGEEALETLPRIGNLSDYSWKEGTVMQGIQNSRVVAKFTLTSLHFVGVTRQRQGLWYIIVSFALGFTFGVIFAPYVRRFPKLISTLFEEKK